MLRKDRSVAKNSESEEVNCDHQTAARTARASTIFMLGGVPSHYNRPGKAINLFGSKACKAFDWTHAR